MRNLVVFAWNEWSPSRGIAGLLPWDTHARRFRGPDLAPSDLFDGDKTEYPHIREWVLWGLQNMPDAQGLMWIPKQDNELIAVMHVGDRMSVPIIDLKRFRHIDHYERLIVELLAEMTQPSRRHFRMRWP
jgi:hypothetical protein